MHLASGLKVNPGKLPKDREGQRWYEDLSEMNIHLLYASDASNLSFINDRKVQLRCRNTVDATFCRASVHQRLQSCQSWDRSWSAGHILVRGIESDIDK